MDEHAQTVGNFLDGRHAKAAARIAALEAELAERTRELEECRQSAFDRAARCAVQRDTIDILTRDLAAERERREAAEKDAARYRWLKINARRIDFAGLCVSDGAQLDARIDAARKD